MNDDSADEVVVAEVVVGVVVDVGGMVLEVVVLELVAGEEDVVGTEVVVAAVVDGTELVVVVGADDAVEDDGPLERAKYAAAPATAITTTITIASTIVAMPFDDLCK